MGVAVGAGVGVTVRAGIGANVGVAVGAGVAVGEGEGVGVGVGVGQGVGVAVGAGVAVGESEGVGVGVGVGQGAGVAVGVGGSVGVPVGIGAGVAVGVGADAGVSVGLGASVAVPCPESSPHDVRDTATRAVSRPVQRTAQALLFKPESRETPIIKAWLSTVETPIAFSRHYIWRFLGSNEPGSHGIPHIRRYSRTVFPGMKVDKWPVCDSPELNPPFPCEILVLFPQFFR